MLSRRRFGKAAAVTSFGALGGLPPQRPDQIHQPSGPAVGAGPRSIGPQPFVVIFGTGPRRGLFVYSPAPGPRNLIASITPAAGTDRYGNTVLAGITSYSPATGEFGQLAQAFLAFSSTAASTRITAEASVSLVDALSDSAAPGITVLSAGTSAGQRTEINAFGKSVDGTAPAQVTIGAPPAGPVTGALVEIQGYATPAGPTLQLVPAAGGDSVLASRISGDTFSRIVANGNGSVSWGTGAATQDVNLQRGAAGVLKISASGGGTVAALEIQEHSAPPTPSGGGRIYVDATGHLHYLGPAGTDTIIANP